MRQKPAGIEKSRVEKLKKFQRKISYKFKDIKLLNQAFTHSSFAKERQSESSKDNERLELLGDAVLDVVITHLLMDKFPEFTEGDLSKARAAIVNEKQLSVLAKKLNLGEYCLLGKGEELSNGRDKDSILAATFEALIAAIYLDRGLKKLFKVIAIHLSDMLAKDKRGFYKDFKSRVQEYAQRFLKTTPSYKITGESGPDHDKTFQVDILIKGRVLGKGSGKSKKEAEQRAAKIALHRLHNNDKKTQSHASE